MMVIRIRGRMMRMNMWTPERRWDANDECQDVAISACTFQKCSGSICTPSFSIEWV
jgi:hypothetical protein